MQLPKRIDQHVTESVSYKIFTGVLPDDWIVRDVTERDYGIDCYIEICVNGFVTGQLISVQLKGADGIGRQENNTIVTCYGTKPSTFNYWNNLLVPTLFVYVDTASKEIFFENIKMYIRRNYTAFVEEKLDKVKIPVTQSLTKETSGMLLRAIYLFEADRQQHEFILTNFITYLGDNLSLIFEHWQRDVFLPVEGKDELRIIGLYRECQFLTSRLEISWNIDPLRKLIEEGQKMFGPNYLLYEYQAAVIAKGLAPIMREILTKATETFTVREVTFWRKHNPLLLHFLTSHEFEQQIRELDECLAQL